MIDIGMYHVGTVSNLDKKFFTVAEESGEVHVYEYPIGEPKTDIRIAIYLSLIHI